MSTDPADILFGDGTRMGKGLMTGVREPDGADGWTYEAIGTDEDGANWTYWSRPPVREFVTTRDNGLLHRLNGPAASTQHAMGWRGRHPWDDVLGLETAEPDEDGECWPWNLAKDLGYEQARWFADGQAHRADSPAVICVDEDGSEFYREWWESGQQHREDGPAVVGELEYQHPGEWILLENWYLRGEPIRTDPGPVEVIYQPDFGVDRFITFELGFDKRHSEAQYEAAQKQWVSEHAEWIRQRG